MKLFFIIKLLLLSLIIAKFIRKKKIKQNPKPGYGRKLEQLKPTETQKAKFLNEINKIRAEIINNYLNYKLESKPSIIKMYWDKNLAFKAKQHGSTCPPIDKPNSGASLRKDQNKNSEGLHGELIYFESVDTPNEKDNKIFFFENVLTKIKETATKDLESDPNYIKDIAISYNPEKAAMHEKLSDFLQLIKSKAYRIGCGFTTCQYDDNLTYKIYVCHFNEGLKTGENIFQMKTVDSNAFETQKFDQAVLTIPLGLANVINTNRKIKFVEEKKYMTNEQIQSEVNEISEMKKNKLEDNEAQN